MFEGIHNAVEAGVWDGRYEIDYSKNVLDNIYRNILRESTRKGSWSVSSRKNL